MSFVKRWAPSAFMLLLIFFESATPGKTVNSLGFGNEEIHLGVHFLLYLLLVLSFYWSTHNIFKSFVFSILYSFTDEYHQTFVPNRQASFFDIFTDSFGSSIAVLILYVVEIFLPTYKGKVWVSKSVLETSRIAKEFVNFIKPGSILALHGDLGAGKTTFTRYLVEHLGFGSIVQSPTFVLVREYSKKSGAIKKVFHVDLYRIKNEKEAEEIGLSDFFIDQSALVIIEWPNIAESILPADTIHVYFDILSLDKRRICIK